MAKDDDAVVALAASHGLRLQPESLEHNGAGLDYHVAYARGTDGREWVLRIPRRADVVAGMAQEDAILALASRHLTIAVPDWRVLADDLIAYPLLPGRPGLTLDGDEATWHVKPGSLRYAGELGRLLATLHGCPVDEARELGVEVCSPAQVRQRWETDVERVAGDLGMDTDLRERLAAWLADDSLWPDSTVFTHGELYPAHVLVDHDDAITGVLDWTTARVDDPARDFMYQYAFGSSEAFATTVSAYLDAGGPELSNLAERCEALMAAGPVGYGLYALATGRQEHRDAARDQLHATA